VGQLKKLWDFAVSGGYDKAMKLKENQQPWNALYSGNWEVKRVRKILTPVKAETLEQFNSLFTRVALRVYPQSKAADVSSSTSADARSYYIPPRLLQESNELAQHLVDKGLWPKENMSAVTDYQTLVFYQGCEGAFDPPGLRDQLLRERRTMMSCAEKAREVAVAAILAKLQ